MLDRELNWIHDGERITHPKIIEAFNQGLVPTGDGRFQLRLGNDWAYVTVEGAAYRVNAIDTDASRPWFEDMSRAQTPAEAARWPVELALAPDFDPAFYGELVQFGKVLPFNRAIASAAA